MIDWATISLKELAGYVSEELRKRGIETILNESSPPSNIKEIPKVLHYNTERLDFRVLPC